MSSKRDVPMRTSISKSNLILKGIPGEYLDYTLDDYEGDPDTKDLIERYINNLHTMYEDRVCLSFFGANGAGKTMLASIIVKEAYRRRYNSHMTTLQHLMELTFNRDKTVEMKDELKYINESEFLVIDELGKENFVQSQSNIALLEGIMRNSVTKGQVLILCTNLPLEELYEMYGKSIQSLIEGDFMKVEFTEQDYRKKVTKNKRGVRILLGGE
jgi:DNA replication protein DnaC